MPKSLVHTIHTIGHSNRSEAEFLELLQLNRIQLVADVRSHPRSRTHPHFAGTELKKSLAERDIGYLHFPELGGRRKPGPKSRNTAWRNKSFQGYADHMASDVFEMGIHGLKNVASTRRVALLCAEAVPWRCHRNLISDLLTAHGWEVMHILSRTKNHVHRMTPFAKVKGRKVLYPGEKPEALPGFLGSVSAKARSRSAER